MNVARLNDDIRGSCTGRYKRWEVVGTSCDSEGSCHPVYGWVDYTETGYVDGEVSQGSTNVFVNGRSMARDGDTVNIHKNYAHSNHYDSLNITGVIVGGSNSVFCNGKKIARKEDIIQDSNCSIVINSGSENVLNNK